MNIVTARKKLMGVLVGLDGQAEHARCKVLDVWREIINFEGQKDNNYGIKLDCGEEVFVHSCAIEELLAGEDISAHLKWNYKGTTIQLIKS